MKARTIVVALIVGWIFAGAVLAEEGKGNNGERNGRGARRHGRFEAADTDGNGSLSLAEFKVIHAKRVAMIKEQIKEKLGAKYDPERAAKRERPSVEEIFARIDTDKSGGLTPQELKKAHQARTKQRKQNGGCRCGRGKPAGQEAD